MRTIRGGIHLTSRGEGSKSVKYRDAEALDKAAEGLDLNPAEQQKGRGREGQSGVARGYEGDTVGR